jgi:hypothetical protein
MFGVVRPCRHRLRGPLYTEWMAHLCGLCLTLRDLHGQSARLVTNYDGLLVSVLTEAQSPGTAPHRTAGPCPLRGFRRADVLDASATGAQLAAAVSLVLAAGKIRDHVTDSDGAYARRMVAAGAGIAAARWRSAGEQAGAAIGFDIAVLTDAVSRQADIERTTGLTLQDVTEPTATAVAAAFAHTAVLADQPRNARPLADAGRHFGRIAHLLDAVQDLPADRAAGLYNPLPATGTTLDQARKDCDKALTGLRLAITDLELRAPILAESLLVSEVGVAVDRVFEQIAYDASRTGGEEGSDAATQGGASASQASRPRRSARPYRSGVPLARQRRTPGQVLQRNRRGEGGTGRCGDACRDDCGESCCDCCDCCDCCCESYGSC